MRKDFDIAIVGGGPAGLTAAIEAKSSNPEAKVIVLEKMEEPAKKLSATGNGRGNLSNRGCELLPTVMEFFSKCGIVTRADDAGRIYPYSEEAKAVSGALIKKAKNLGAEILTKSSVSNVEVGPEGHFHIFFLGGKDCLVAKKLLIATGGKSFANYGSSGDGYTLARKLGHSVTPLVPALTAIEVSEDIKDLKGVRAKVKVALMEEGNIVIEEEGEIQFRDDAVSGICVMNLSSKLPVGGAGSNVPSSDACRNGGSACGDSDSLAHQSSACRNSTNRYENCRILVNFVPDFSTVELMEFIKGQCATEGIRVSEILETLVKKPVAVRIIKDAGLDGNAPATGLQPGQMVHLANLLRRFSLAPCGKKGWKEAQVTKGGVSLDEINMGTMESNLVEGLYFAGEVIDYDGPCGGYNLHNAWLTGMKAGKDMADRV